MRPTLGTSEVAAICGTTEQHVRKLARQRRIPHVRVGASYKFDRDEIDRWLEAHRVTLAEVSA